MIRLATLEDVKRICATRGDYYDDPPYVQNTVICEQDSREMLFTMLRVNDIAEVHVYCSPRHMKGFKAMAEEFMAKCRESGIKRLVTLTDKSKAINGTAEKMGFKMTASFDKYDKYERYL